LDDAKLGRVLTLLRAERPCTKTWTNLRMVPICMKKSKCWVLHLGWGSPGCMYRLRARVWRAAPQRDLGVQLGDNLNLSWQCALAARRANCTLGTPGPALPVKEVVVPFCSVQCSRTSSTGCRFGCCYIRRT